VLRKKKLVQPKRRNNNTKRAETSMLLLENALRAFNGIEEIVIPSAVSSCATGSFSYHVTNIVVDSASVYLSTTSDTSNHSIATRFNGKLKVHKSIVDDVNNVNDYLNDTSKFNRVLDGDYYLYTMNA